MEGKGIASLFFRCSWILIFISIATVGVADAALQLRYSQILWNQTQGNGFALPHSRRWLIRKVHWRVSLCNIVSHRLGRFGFVREGTPFEEYGASHVQMKRVLSRTDLRDALATWNWLYSWKFCIRECKSLLFTYTSMEFTCVVLWLIKSTSDEDQAPCEIIVKRKRKG